MEQLKNRDLAEDEIDLKELFSTIWKNRWKIGIFAFFVTTATIIFIIFKPNVYKSEIILLPQEQKSGVGGLGALAGLAGVDIGGGEVSPFTSLETVIKNFSFNISIVKKYSLLERLENRENLVYPFGLDIKFEPEIENLSLEEREFNIYKYLQTIVSISEDQKSGLITISVEMEDRFFAKELVDIYLEEATSFLRELDRKNIDSQIEYYEKELENSGNIELQQKLSQLLSTLIQKRVLADASQFYTVKKITDSNVAFIKDKTKPKRALIVVVAFVTSIIMGIFGVFFLEFLRNEKK
jgi:LPS O-antigen subunit length determinant protein (WzzB/FepE family)